MSTWQTINDPIQPYLQITGKACYITLERRRHYCDRGNWIAKIFQNPDVTTRAWIELSLDNQDGWPRYYFDEARAKLEVEAWLEKRKQAL